MFADSLNLMQLFDKLCMCHWFAHPFLYVQRYICSVNFIWSKIARAFRLAIDIVHLKRINYFVSSGFFIWVQLMRIVRLILKLNVLVDWSKIFCCSKICNIDICNPFGLQRYLVVFCDFTSQDSGWNRLIFTLDSWSPACITTVRGLTMIWWSPSMHFSILTKRFLCIHLMYFQIFVIFWRIFKIHFWCKLWEFKHFKLRIFDELFVHIRDLHH